MNTLLVILAFNGFIADFFIIYLISTHFYMKWCDKHEEDNHVETNFGRKL